MIKEVERPRSEYRVRSVPKHTNIEDLLPGTIVMFPRDGEIDKIRNNSDFEVTCSGQAIWRVSGINLEINNNPMSKEINTHLHVQKQCEGKQKTIFVPRDSTAIEPSNLPADHPKGHPTQERFQVTSEEIRPHELVHAQSEASQVTIVFESRR